MVAFALTPHEPRRIDVDRIAVPAPTVAPEPRFLQLQHLAALQDHRRYLTALLAAYSGPYRNGWTQELEAVLAQIAALNG